MLRSLPVADPTWEMRVDVVVLGAGAAGLSAALAIASRGDKVLVVSKGIFGSGSTPWAQGGLAATLASDDRVELHATDTRVAGGGLCNEDAIRELTATAPAEIAALRELGADFDRDATNNRLDLGREGGHSRHRVVHAGGDASGVEISRTLWAAVDSCDSIEILEPAVALDVLLSRSGRVNGVLIGCIDSVASHLLVGVVHASAVVLATGGVGQLFATTTNPPGATGDGLAIAARAGAELVDLEFVQFHPTVLWKDPTSSGQRVLITEALRGAGAQLLDANGVRFMLKRHELAELAPRDVVSAAMQQVMTETGAPHVWLDARMFNPDLLERDFPTMLKSCALAGIDPHVDLIPVSPGAHYFCGGVRTDLDGRTTVPGLFAAGEVACTGVHGANRLASNSLTEAVLFGRKAGEATQDGSWRPTVSRHDGLDHMVELSTATLDLATRRLMTEEMTRYAGVMRTASGLEKALDTLRSAPAAAPGNSLSLDDVEVCALHTSATLIATAALLREESRGCHRRNDFPNPCEEWAARHITVGARMGAGQSRERIPA